MQPTAYICTVPAADISFQSRVCPRDRRRRDSRVMNAPSATKWFAKPFWRKDVIVVVALSTVVDCILNSLMTGPRIPFLFRFLHPSSPIMSITTRNYADYMGIFSRFAVGQASADLNIIRLKRRRGKTEISYWIRIYWWWTKEQWNISRRVTVIFYYCTWICIFLRFFVELYAPRILLYYKRL